MGHRFTRPARERVSKRVIVDHAHQPISDGFRPGISNEYAFRTALQDFTGRAGRVGYHDAQTGCESLDDGVGIAFVAGLIRCVG